MTTAEVKPWPANLPPNRAFPPVTIVTPTYNRRKFIPWIIECIKSQTYPLERMEWLVYDDGTDNVEDLVAAAASVINVRYFRSDIKLNVGAKRNRLNDEARGELIVTMDDDDYYPPERVSHAVQILQSKDFQICGSTRNTLFFSDNATIWETGPYAQYHATFGTMAYTRRYAANHRCDETVTHAEELQFTNKFSEPLYQLDPRKVMLVMCHSQNTFNKHALRTDTNPLIRKTTYKLKNIIRSVKLRDFYMTA